MIASTKERIEILMSFDKDILMRLEKRDPARKTWGHTKIYFEKWTKREEVYDPSFGGTLKKARFKNSLNTRTKRQPEP